MHAKHDHLLLCLAFLAGQAGGASCVVWLERDDDPLDTMPCGPPEDLECPEGFSCLIDSCVADHGLHEGETCNQSIQCEEGMACATGDFTCRKTCSEFTTLDNCRSDYICMPSFENNSFRLAEPGLCLPSACELRADCNVVGGDVCVSFPNGNGQCLPFCKYLIEDGEYVDHLLGSCQPFGAADVLVRWPVGTAALDHPCDPVDNPCVEGLACIQPDETPAPRCHKLCDSFQPWPDSGCAAGKGCVHVNRTGTNGDGWDYCEP